MKEHRLSNWKLEKELDSLLFFALRIRELVFDYTLDSFKYPALNSTSICEEAVQLIKEIETNNITEKSITPVLEELIWKLKKDKIVGLILENDLEYYLNFGDYSNLKDVKLKLEILTNKLNSLKYADYTEKELIKLVNENKEKREIYELATNYITSLINIGFSQSFIYLATNTHFFSNRAVTSIEDLKEYFKLFDHPYQEYNVILKCSKILGEIEDSSNKFHCTVSQKIEEKFIKLDKNKFIESKNSKELYFSARKILALDPLSAKTLAENRINKLSKLFVFYHHKQHPTWSEKALVINCETDTSFLINERTSPMSKGRDLIPKKAAVKLSKLMRGLKLESTSFAKYDRVIDLHGLSIENKNIENQLLQNWIAFETLLVGYSSQSKISQVIENLVPFLKVKYLDTILYEFLKDVSRYNYSFFLSEIRKIEVGNTPLEKFVAIISLDEFKDKRILFYKALEKSPLLKFRLSEFQKILSSPKKIKQFIDNHEKKVIWQIKRMYRSRNLIVHAGTVPEYTESLVENSHTYLDLVINIINELSIDKQSIHSIEQTIKEVQIQVHKNNKVLSKNFEKEVDRTNYLQLILNK